MGRRIRDLFADEYAQARAVTLETARLRRLENLSQGDVAKLSGYSQSGISEWEWFKMPNFALVTLIRIARATGYKVVITFEKEEE